MTFMVMRAFFQSLFNGPIWRTFLLMGVFGGLFASSSYNLLELFTANYRYVSDYGIMALMEGGLRQLLELILFGYLSVGFYILFKGCLYGLLAHVAKH
ncbi:hypothetical protein ACETRX_32845 [Labrys portucalensis]|uniref:DUF2523 domain-containing protein n=1 Tax=Labrys neptuniae TaxID=376174 RepID=A0ABV6ZQK6_9HYPH